MNPTLTIEEESMGISTCSQRFRALAKIIRKIRLMSGEQTSDIKWKQEKKFRKQQPRNEKEQVKTDSYLFLIPKTPCCNTVSTGQTPNMA